MITIDLKPISSQSISVQIDDVTYKINIKTTNITVLDFYKNDNPLILGVIARPSISLIPYEYLSDKGSFIFQTKDGALPYYSEFGITQFLVFATKEELIQ